VTDEGDVRSFSWAQGVVFDTMDALKLHYKSDWHRYNLKRGVAGLPVVGKDLFDRVMTQAAAQEAASKKRSEGGTAKAGKSHLKRKDELPRSVLRAQRFEKWAEAHKETLAKVDAYIARGEEVPEELLDEISRRRGDDNDDEDVDEYEGEWEEMDEDETQEALANIERAAQDAESSDEDMDDDAPAFSMEELTNGPVRLADNGYELIIIGADGKAKRIGPREFRRYYKQNHRPHDGRDSVRANARHVGMQVTNDGVRRGSGGGITRRDYPTLPTQISLVHRRAQRALRKYQGDLMVMGGSANKKFDMNGRNAKTKLPKACPY
jgi:pre-60S factor REI1